MDQWIYCACAATVLLALGAAANGELPESQGVLPALDENTGRFGDSSGNAPKATMQMVDVTGQPFAKAARVTVPIKTSPDYKVQLVIRTAEPVAKGQVCLLRFWMRTISSEDETTQGKVRVYFQSGEPNWTKSADYTAQPAGRWQRFDVPFRSNAAYAAGKAEVGLAFGERVQVVEVAAVQVLAFGKDVQMRDLPQSKSTYLGREADAPWRKAAAERIAKYRMGDLTVKVTDANGDPVSGAQVTIELRQHAFGFGSAVTAYWLKHDGETADTYRKHVLELFNRVVLENDLKWGPWENQWGTRYNRQQTLGALRWLNDHDITVHGHVMVWPNWQHIPKDARQLENDHPALRKRITEHIVEQVNLAGPYITDWDVINEPFSNHQIMDILGNDVMVDWFRTARQANGEIRLMINDYGILTTGGEVDTPHQNHYEKTIRFLLDNGAPVDAIGLQGHFGSGVTPPAKLGKIIDRFAAFGLPLHITEFDINTSDEQMQADYTRDFMTVIFSRPEFESFTMWGFWEGAHWRKQAAMYRQDWTPKPNAEAYRKLVLEQWHTRASGSTNGAGAFTQRGYCGKYEVTVAAAGKTKTVTASLPRKGAAITVRLD